MKSTIWTKFWESKKTKLPPIWEVIAQQSSSKMSLRIMEKEIASRFGSFKGLNVIEIGAGRGTAAIWFALKGSKAAVLDYSEEAINLSKKGFQKMGLRATFFTENVLRLPDGLLEKFDVCMSFGLAEHFGGAERERVIKAHFNLLRKGGIAFISVPNKKCFPYRMEKAIRELLNLWPIGLEIPFSQGELEKIAHKVESSSYKVIASSCALNDFLEYWYYKPLRTIRSLVGGKYYTIKRIPLLPTFLDKYFSYSILLIGEK